MSEERTRGFIETAARIREQQRADKDTDDSGRVADALMSLALQGELARLKTTAPGTDERLGDIREALTTLTGWMLRDIAARSEKAR